MSSVCDSFTIGFQSSRMVHGVGSKVSNGSQFAFAKSTSSAYSHSVGIPLSVTGWLSYGVLSLTACKAAAKQYQAISSNSKVYFGSSIPSMFMEGSQEKLTVAGAGSRKQADSSTT